MASILTDNSKKSNKLINEALSPYIAKVENIDRNSPDYEKFKNYRITQIENGILDIGSLAEVCMESQNPETLKRVKGAQNGWDFEDNSDAKTSSFGRYDHMVGHLVYDRYECSIVKKNKTGLLRCIIGNPFNDTVVFFLIPHSVYSQFKHNSFKIRYNPSKNAYGKFEEYRVDTFEELCSDYVAPVSRYQQHSRPVINWSLT